MTKRKASVTSGQATGAKRVAANNNRSRRPPATATATGQKKVRFRRAAPASSKSRSKKEDLEDDDEKGNEDGDGEEDDAKIPEQETKEAEENSDESDHESKTEIKPVMAKKGKTALVEDEDLSAESDDSDSEATSSTSGSETDNEVDEIEVVLDTDSKTSSSATPSPLVSKKPKLSAATLKTKMSPSGLQNPISRRKIWKHLTLMMERSGYRAVAHAKPPTDEEEILPNNRNVLGQFHCHFVDTNAGDESSPAPSLSNEAKKIREPVYVLFASKAGEPTLKSLTFHSRHLILITDSLTGRAKTVLQSLPVRAPPLVAKESKATVETKEVAPLTLNDVFVEAFVSKDFMFDLPRQRYLNVMQFSKTPLSEVQQVCTIYGTRKRTTGSSEIWRARSKIHRAN